MSIHEFNNNSLVNNLATLKRPIIFDGIQHDKVSPMDIDACIELYDKYLIFFEVKTKGTPITTAQSLVLRRIVDAWCKSSVNKKAWIFHATHKPKVKEIMLQDCIVENIYTRGKWSPLSGTLNVKEALQMLGNKYKIHHLQNIPD